MLGWSWSDRCVASRRWVVLAALLGLLAMHGLGAHGTAHRAHASESMAPVSTGHSAPPTADGRAATSAPASGSPYAEQDPGLLGVSALCLAVLLVGVGLAVVLGRRRAVVPTRTSTPDAITTPVRGRRDRDPPCLFALSIQRC